MVSERPKIKFIFPCMFELYEPYLSPYFYYYFSFDEIGGLRWQEKRVQQIRSRQQIINAIREYLLPRFVIVVLFQKLIYFMTKGNIKDLGYDFRLFNYGPYSFQLKEDLNFMEESGIIKKIPDPTGFGYKYLPNEKIQYVRSVPTEMKSQEKVDELIKKFKGIPAKNLGLLATFMYIYDRYDIHDDEHLISTVKTIKPMFSEAEFESTLHEYREMIKGNIIDFIEL